MKPLLREEAKARQLAGLKKGTESPLRSKDRNGETQGNTDALAGKLMGVGEASVRRADRVRREEAKKRQERGIANLKQGNVKPTPIPGEDQKITTGNTEA